MWRRCRDALIAALLALNPTAAAPQGLYFEGGLSFARGDYVYTQHTNGGGAWAGLAWSSRRLTARATLPFVVRDTRLLTVSTETTYDPVDPSLNTNGYDASLSDPVVQVYGQAFQSDRTGLGLSTSIKVPMVDTGYFGTGQWDVGAAASLSQFVGSTMMLGVDVSYWHLGDMPELALRDSVTGTLTVGRIFGHAWNASLSLSGGRSTVTGYDDLGWVSLLLGRSYARGMVGFAASLGLTDTAPDFTFGLIWRARLDRAASTRGR